MSAQRKAEIEAEKKMVAETRGGVQMPESRGAGIAGAGAGANGTSGVMKDISGGDAYGGHEYAHGYRGSPLDGYDAAHA